MGVPVSRLGDSFSCTDTSAGGSGTVFVDGIPVTRIGDPTNGHSCGIPYAPPTTNAGGSGTVFADGIPICRVGDPLTPHKCGSSPHGGVFITGSGTVFAG